MKTLETICSLLEKKNDRVDAWFGEKWQGLMPLPYFSCDIRHAAYKIGIVDTNLFPAGFNNLCASFTKDTARAFGEYFDRYYPRANNVLLFGENHTRNKFYLMNLVKLKELIIASGRQCRITLPLDNFSEPRFEIALDESHTIVVEKLDANGLSLVGSDFTADLVLSNNDFSAGLPDTLKNSEVPVIPPPQLGWHNRTKNGHFALLSALIADFGQSFDLDPWTLTPITATVGGVEESNLAELARVVDETLAAIRKKYDEYKITETPYVFIKNDSGTYGLGILTATNGDELLTLNRKKRSKLFSAKSGAQTNRFIVQEGIPTSDTYSGYPIEPVIYGVGERAVAGFFRFHESKDPFESLNAPGMGFSCLCLHKLDEPHESYFINCRDKQRLVSGAKFLARFAALAAAME